MLTSGRLTLSSVLLALVLVSAGCAAPATDSGDRGDRVSARDPAVGTDSAPAPVLRHRRTRFVVAISVDGLNASALKRLGRRGAPNFHRLLRQGTATLNARTEYERTITLPNHTGMLTGRRVNRNRGGHGVYFNTDSGITVHDAAGSPVASVFDVVHDQGRRTALFTSKAKFELFRRSWPASIDRFTVHRDNKRLMNAVRADLRRRPRAFTFVHLSAPDRAGHRHGFLSAAYYRAVRKTDRRVGELLRTIQRQDLDRLTLVLTADHGGTRGHGHGDADRFSNYRVPFLTWGAGVARGVNLYRINPDFHSPGHRRPGYRTRRQPVRNGMVANLTTSLLGMPAVPGSTLDPDQSLRLHR